MPGARDSRWWGWWLLLAGALAAWRWACQGGAKFGARHFAGTLLGLMALGGGVVAFISLVNLAQDQRNFVPRDVTLLAPVQQAGSALTVEVMNLEEETSAAGFARYAWPVLVGLAAWIYGWVTRSSGLKAAGWVAGWFLLAWAALRYPNGAPPFLLVLGAFLAVHTVIPGLRRLARLPNRPANEPPRSAPRGASPAAAGLLLAFLGLGLATSAYAQSTPALRAADGPILMAQASESAPQSKRSARTQAAEGTDHKTILAADNSAMAESVVQEIRIEDKFALATAKIRWVAEKGAVLPLLFEPAVLTRLEYPSNALELVAPTGAKVVQQLQARKKGTYTITARYEVQLARRGAEGSLILPVPSGLINRLDLTVANLDVDVFSPQAVLGAARRFGQQHGRRGCLLARRHTRGGLETAHNRDLKREKPVFLRGDDPVVCAGGGGN